MGGDSQFKWKIDTMHLGGGGAPCIGSYVFKFIII